MLLLAGRVLQLMHGYMMARSRDLHIPDGKYYLTDSGFPASQQLLVPYHGTQYHLKEWGHADQCEFLDLL
jgi:hypothetical protein